MLEGTEYNEGMELRSPCRALVVLRALPDAVWPWRETASVSTRAQDVVRWSVDGEERCAGAAISILFQTRLRLARPLHVVGAPRLGNGQRSVRHDQIRNAMHPRTSIPTPNRIT